MFMIFLIVFFFFDIMLFLCFRWLIAYRDALSFRSSHYFVSYLASTLLVLAGFPFPLSTMVKPLYIELPRSLVQVVIHWNIPMHYWLKTCMYKCLINIEYY